MFNGSLVLLQCYMYRHGGHIGCLITSGDSEVDKLVPGGVEVSGCTIGTASRGFSSFSS
jgi:hypothetical protein